MADRSVRVVLDAAVGGFVSGMGTAAQSAVGFARTAGAAIDRNEASFNQLAGTALKVGVGLTAVAGFAVKAAMDWESAWAGVLKTVDGTPRQLAAVEQGLRDLATSMPESHQNIAAVAEAAGQLGIARENVVAFTKTMVMLGDTTNLTAEEAATSMAQFMNIMGTAPHQVDNLGSALVELGNNGASTERQIIEMAQRIAGAGRIAGLTEANVLGLASAVASTGIEVEAGGTAISQTMIAATQAVATNSDELLVWADTAGLSAQQFADMWKEDPAQAFQLFVEGLRRQGQGAFETLDQIGLNGVRVGRALLNLAGAGDLLGKAFADSDRAMRENNALLEEAEKRYDTSAAKARIAWNQIKDAAIDAGQGLLPVLNGVMDAVGGVAEAFRSLPGPIKTGLTILTGMGGAALLTVAAVIKVTQALRGMGTAMGIINTSNAGAAAGGALGGFARGATIAGAAVAGLSIAVNAFSNADPASVKKWTAAFLDLEKGAKGSKASLDSARAGLEDLVNVAFEKDTFGNMFEDLNPNAVEDFFGGLLGGIGIDQFGAAEASIQNIDAALTELVTSGNVDAARLGFDALSIAAAKEGVSIQRLRELLPQYSDALGTLAEEQQKATKGSQTLNDRLSELGGGDIMKGAEELLKMQDAVRETSRAFLGFDSSLKDAGGSFDAWINNLKDQQKAMEEWSDNIIKLAARGVPDDFLQHFIEAGPEKMAGVVEGLADMSKSGLAEVVDIWTDAGSRIADGLMLIPSEKRVYLSMTGDEEMHGKIAAMLVDVGMLDKDIVTTLEAAGAADKDIRAILELAEQYRNSNPTTTVDADTGPARAELEDFFNFLTGGPAKPEPIPIEGDTAPAKGDLGDLLGVVDNSEGTMGIDGNNKPAKNKTDKAKQYADSRRGTLTVDANTDPAKRAIRAVINAFDKYVINLLVFANKGGAMGMRVPPGFAGGGVAGYANGRVPGTPPADPRRDNVMAMSPRGNTMLVRSGEWIVNEKQSEKNDNWLRAINDGLDLNKMFGPVPSGAFATGARMTASSTGSRPANSGPQLVSVELTDAQVEVGVDGIGRFVRGTVDVMLADREQHSQRVLGQKIRGGG